jgi:hypothetical protein
VHHLPEDRPLAAKRRLQSLTALIFVLLKLGRGFTQPRPSSLIAFASSFRPE